VGRVGGVVSDAKTVDIFAMANKIIIVKKDKEINVLVEKFFDIIVDIL
jgi:hypothetical protein